MVRALAFVLAMVLAFAALAAAPAAAVADGTDSGGSATITDDITDTENLLGADASRVSDAIARVDRSAGVHVKLLFLETFGLEKGQTPEAWAMRQLESLHPKPNTVMLAVASGDGSLVVVVSPNSDEWLRGRATVDDLSAAAAEPLASGGQDWAGSVLALVDGIEQAKRTSTSRRAMTIGVAAMGVVVVVLAAAGVAVAVRRRRREAAGGAARGKTRRARRGRKARRARRGRRSRTAGAAADEAPDGGAGDGGDDSTAS